MAKIGVDRGGEEQEQLHLALGESIDLWRWCDEAGTPAVAAVSGQRTVVGTCGDRAKRWFSLRLDATRGLVAELRRGGEHGPLAASLDAVERVTLARAADAPAAGGMPAVFVDGVASATLLPAEVPDRQVGRHHRMGRSLRASLVAAGLDVASVARVELVGDAAAERSSVLDRAWFATAGNDVRLRRNRRGQWRASVVQEGREVARVGAVTQIRVNRAR